MDIVYAGDDKFAWIMGVSMLSLMESNGSAERIHFHILDGGIECTNKEKIVAMTGKYGRDCSFYPAKETVERVMKGHKTPRSSLSMFSRLFIGQLLPKNLTKVLYLDCDTLVIDSLTELWSMVFEGNILVAVNDCCSNMHRSWVYLKKNQPYLQTGMMLIDMESWRNFGVEEKVSEAIRRLHGVGPYGDQCLLSMVLSDRTKLVHPRYNCLISRCVFTYSQLLQWRRPSFFYSKEEVQESVAHPVVIHFATFFHAPRPWIKTSPSEGFYKEWKAYLRISPWKDHPLWVDDRPWWFKVMVGVYHALPLKIAIPSAGLIHSFFMPAIGMWMNRLTKFIAILFSAHRCVGG
ncbi:MAG: glycosyltransferase family 8 protein [Tannerellaceae bacterium]|jgi:lipopolysaccharide biosynthesis glycosyltransferase|nr:glycosyltransferase family 8 protein [Tannerellaceae bacterium]